MFSKKDVSLKIEHFPRGQDAEFRIISKKEMMYILQDIAEKGTRVALYHDEAQNFIMTSLYGANEEGLWLDVGPSHEENKRILLSHKITFVSLHQHVKVQFMAPKIVRSLLEGDETFYVDLPDYLLRIQRRDYFRLNIPASNPVKCVVPIKPYNPDKPDESEVIRNIPVIDISGGGVCLLCGEQETDLYTKAVFQDCLISLPDSGTIRVNIEVKNHVKFTSRDGLVHTRVGCHFVRLNNQASSLLQSYITRLQSELLVKGLNNEP